MNRCAALAFFAGLTAAAFAQEIPRSFPANSLRGELVVVQPPEIKLNGNDARLAPGARIRGPNNLLVMSATIVGQKLLVNYTADELGLVKDIWVLRQDEAAKVWPKTPAEAASWRFDPVAQVWTK